MGVERGEGRGGTLARPARKSLRALCCFINYLFRFCANGRAQGSRSSSSSRRQAHTHTQTTHIPCTHTHTEQHTLGQTRAGRFGHFVLGLPTARPERNSYITRHIGGYIYVYICMCACVWLHMLYSCSSCIVYSAFHWII